MYFSSTILLAFAAALPALSAPLDTPKVVAHTAPNNETMRAFAEPRWSGPWWNFPGMDTWTSFYDMFDRNKPSMLATGSTHDDVGRIFVGIVEASRQIGVDERVILGIIMQESHGNVGVITTYNMDGQPTAGLMQCLNCPGFPGQHGLSQVRFPGYLFFSILLVLVAFLTGDNTGANHLHDYGRDSSLQAGSRD